MEKRLILAIALSALVVVAWNYMFPPPKRVPQPTSAPQTVISEGAADAEAPAPEEPYEITYAAAAAAAAEESVQIRTDLFEVELTNRGGRATSWKLVDYTTDDGQPLELLPTYEDNGDLTLGLELDDQRLSAQLNAGLYEVSREALAAAGSQGAGEAIRFHWSDGRGLEATKTFGFRQGSYLVDVDVEVLDRGRRETARLVLGPGFGAQERRKTSSDYYDYRSQAVWNLSGQVTRKKQGKLDDDGAIVGNLAWAGIEDKFFALLAMPGSDRAQLTWRTLERIAVNTAVDGEDQEKPDPKEEPLLAVSIADSGGRLYVGPKKYRLLQNLGSQLEEVVWFSSYGWLAWIVKHIYLGLLWIHDNITGNYGLAIVLATVILRIVLFPVNQYAMVSMKKTQLQMQRLQPKIKSIRSKYKKAKDIQSRNKMNQEMMDLYKKEGVNPAGGVAGCLPLFAQFPILIGFYNMLTVAVELRGAPFFGWIQDLSVKDPLWVTPLLMGATMFAQQKMSMTKVKDPQQLQQQRIMMFMPFMFTFICLQMPAGLVLYWFVNNLLGIGQQWLVNRHTGRLEAQQQAT